ncbi:MAG: large conductance mechanosensitive channel protein MscL [Eggerthellaceae bacterium]|nr:large conductance mechanosensitive channel protein MscL [Eggerthellaceae bacterium]
MAEEKKGFMGEFKEFIAQGNVMNLAVGIIIGGAFQAIVGALVEKVIMPIVGAAMGGVDFSGLAITIGSAEIGYGAFIQACIDFLLIALVVFWIVKAYNKAVTPKEEPEARTCPYCKQEIADDATRCPHCTSEVSAA